MGDGGGCPPPFAKAGRSRFVGAGYGSGAGKSESSESLSGY
jgi:hypothetical protein